MEVIMKSICGIDCNNCNMKETCKGCQKTGGHPFGGRCVTAECFKKGGETAFKEYKNKMIEEFNALGIEGMQQITELCSLCGSYVNLEYMLPNGQRIKLLNDNNIYLGYQVEKEGSNRCYGLVGDDDYLLVSEYGCNGAEPQIIAYRKR
jgi:hypothetical protein